MWNYCSINKLIGERSKEHVIIIIIVTVNIGVKSSSDWSL